jgi:hypothetical protein
VLSSAIGVTISVAIDNDIRVFLNGQELTDGFQTHEGCPELDNFSYAAQGLQGENTLVIQARDRGVISYVNVRVEQSQ